MARPIEVRLAATNLEIREGDGLVTLVGYASTFNEPYNMGGYTETVKPTAFRETLGRKPDVRFLINHGGLPLARTSSGTLRLSTDARGLRVEADVDPTDPDVQALLPKMRRGDLNQMSFGFRVSSNGDEWTENYTQRALTNLDLNDGDVSVVTYPANPATSIGVGARSVEAPYEAAISGLAAMRAAGASIADARAFVLRVLGDDEAAEALVEAEEATAAPEAAPVDALDAEAATDAEPDEAPETTEDAERVSALAAAELRRRQLAAL